MPLPESGSISASMINVELGRASNAPFSLGGATERGLAGVPSGGLSFATFRGKASEIAKTLTGGTGAVTLQSLFTTEEWTSSTPKRVTLPAATIRGRSDSPAAVVSVGPDAWAGPLTFDVYGTIEGAGGAAGGGVGGTAFDANRTGLTGQTVNVNVFGALKAGGGGGGAGGNGGDGSTTVQTREPATGELFANTNPATNPTNFIWHVSSTVYGYVDYGGTRVTTANPGLSVTTVVFGGWTYQRGTLRVSTAPGQPFPYPTQIYAVFRTQDTITATIGGAGGSGGRGEGHGQTRADGIAGLVGGANAGQGGTGGRGGLFGADGNSGSSGTNGTVTGGLTGGSAGLSGFALANIVNASLVNSGTLLGRT